LDFVFTVASQSNKSSSTGTSQFEGIGNSKALFTSHGEDLTHIAAAGTQIGRSLATPDRANSRSFSLQDAPNCAIVIEQCMKALRLSKPAAAWPYPLLPGVLLLNIGENCWNSAGLKLPT